MRREANSRSRLLAVPRRTLFAMPAPRPPKPGEFKPQWPIGTTAGATTEDRAAEAPDEEVVIDIRSELIGPDLDLA